MALTLVVIDAKTRNGTPFVEWAAGVGRLTGGARTTMRGAVAWVIAMNLCYLLFFIGPEWCLHPLGLPPRQHPRPLGGLYGRPEADP